MLARAVQVAAIDGESREAQAARRVRRPAPQDVTVRRFGFVALPDCHQDVGREQSLSRGAGRLDVVLLEPLLRQRGIALRQRRIGQFELQGARGRERPGRVEQAGVGAFVRAVSRGEHAEAGVEQRVLEVGLVEPGPGQFAQGLLAEQ